MAQIAEDLFLLLLDNASAQPGLDVTASRAGAGGAVLLDLALRVPDPARGARRTVEAGRLVALAGPGRSIPSSSRRSAAAATAAEPRRRGVQAAQAHPGAAWPSTWSDTGQIRRVRLPSKRFSRLDAWPLTNRERVGAGACGAAVGAVRPHAARPRRRRRSSSLLHAVDGLGALLSLNDRGWRWVHARAGEIASGSWVDEYPTALPEVNLAVTASALRGAHAPLT